MTNNEPKGVGGWLLLFVFGQVFLGPLSTIEDISQMWDHIGPHPFPVARQIVNILTVIFVVMAAYGITVGILIWSGNKHSRTLARHYLLIQIGVAVIIFGSLTSWSYNMLGVPGAQRTAASIVSPFAREIGLCLIWFAYFTYSKRVRNTFGPQPKTEAPEN
jgi:hypothetical protein